ncbi:MAG: class I SAM-dependent methyltransferase [Bacteroidetes bacterium]|nr:class I SAM-dependent methyltransferase [Bacteroidota bacterium]
MIEKIDYLENFEFANYYDIACGKGWFTSVILESCKAVANVTGIDITEKFMQDFYESIGDIDAQFIACDINNYNWEENTEPIDCLSLSLALHHIDNINSVMSEMYTNLSEGGLLIIYEMISDGLTRSQLNHKEFHHLHGKMDRDNGEYHQDVFTLKEVKEIITSAGFSIVYENLEKNDEIRNMSPEVTETLQTQTEGKIPRVYGSDIPDEVLKRKEELLENLKIHGFAPPPLYLCIGKK